MKLNVLYILNDTVFGGAGMSLRDTLNGIRDGVNPIVIIREDAEETVEKFFDGCGICHYKLPFSIDFVKKGSIDKIRQQLNLQQNYDAALELVSIIKKEKIELIHINSSVSYFAALAALMTDIPYVWHVRELMYEHFGMEVLNEELKKKLYAGADRIIVISDYVGQRYLEKYGIKASRLYDGLDVGKYRQEIENDKTFQNIFLAVGMISPQKGQWDAVHAVEILLGKGYSDIQLVIVGDRGESYTWAMKKYVRRKGLAHNVSILPFQENLSQLREEASYAITCSQSEALGRVTIEAMLAGHFVLGARSGATTELIGEGEERGILYDLHDGKALAEAMLRAMQCPREVKMRIMAGAQSYAESTFDASRYCRELMDLYEEVMQFHQTRDAEALLHEIQDSCEYSQDVSIQNEQSSGQIRKLEVAHHIALKWLEIRQSGHVLEEYFKANGIHSIAIYGMAALGRRLYDELEDGCVEVRYFVDRNPGGMDNILPFASLEGEKLDVDAVVVTVAAAERQVVNEIKGKGYGKVLGLSDVLGFFENGFS